MTFISQETAHAYLPALEWLLDDEGARRSGRTTLLAIASIRLACKNPGKVIRYSDHAHTDVAMRNLRDVVMRLIAEDRQLQPFLVRADERGFSVKLPKPIDWIPMGWRKARVSRWDLIK